MEIQKRSSHGRGEYEIAGSHQEISVGQLTERQLTIATDTFGLIPTGVAVRNQGGKARLRLIGSGIQLHRQIEAILLLPKSIREEKKLLGGEPVILRDRYILQRIGLANVKLDQGEDSAIVELGRIDCVNDSCADDFEFRERLGKVAHLDNCLKTLPKDIAVLVQFHLDSLRSGQPFGATQEKNARKIATLSEAYAPEYNKSVISGGDVLDFLIEVADVPIITEPPSLDDIDPIDIEIRRTVAVKWRAFRERGPSGAKFRRDVREAYRSTCLICGLGLPALGDLKVPGVDAAHILPWAKYDMDLVSNGVCLCKFHHWAFDHFILAIFPKGNHFVVALTDLAGKVFKEYPATLAELRRHEGPLETSRLPKLKNQWPNPECLRRLYQDVGILFD